MNGHDPVPQPPVPAAAGQRLPKALRLDSAGFRSTFENGKSLASRLFAMWILRLQGDGVGRVGTVASKRTFHDAVQRNRARRLLRLSDELESVSDEASTILKVTRRLRRGGQEFSPVSRDVLL